MILALTSCKKEEKPAPTAKDAAASSPTVQDAGPGSAPASLPMDPGRLLARLPEPPAPVPVHPGDPAATLRQARPGLRPSEVSDRVLAEDLAEGPFRAATYVLSHDGSDVVEGIVLTLAPEYLDPPAWKSLTGVIERKLGAGAAVEPPYEGTRWSVSGYRIELRRDPRSGEGELLFHRRGGREFRFP